MAKYLTKADVISLLRRRIEEAGEQKALAEQFGISPQYLSDVLNDKREPGESILVGLGLKKVVVYQKPLFTERENDRSSTSE